ncbi:MBL fold metallo-hydrolase [Edaphobacter modestus]|uniref:Metallo-beta-lactamase superfamily protein n=1 Tax=Edaphobacter modestus TaxID=388466 RepID=A0A4Q7YRK3_9BACT|nr:MBL fold metallo-hydrolase [Edaphobacter modestus]RZU40337.1 metallo-beta-lactamase superfamily protein [Edaphobacter modestus]
MKLTAFQSDKGDCLLMETADGAHRMLIDGGMRDSYSAHVAPTLGKLREAGKKMDVVYISHIDQDHIAGVLRLLDDEVEWRIHEHLIANGNPGHRAPKSPRPPEIGQIWHNSFHEQVGKNAGPVEDMLAATAEILSGANHPVLREIAQDRRDLATSIPEAMRVSSRIRHGQLNIPLNPEFNGKLMLVQDGRSAIKLGSIKLNLIGPFEKDLKKLREEWNDWLRANRERVKQIRQQARADEDALADSSLSQLFGPMESVANDLGASELALAKILGNRKNVTTPNLASLMFMALDEKHTVLLTGDGHWEDILAGLEHHGAFDSNNKLHVTVLKVQHHGSEHNIKRTFCDRVSADNYVFCGNGEHENPDLDVIQEIFDRRMVNDTSRFKFWFNSSSAASTDEGGVEHMKAVERLTRKLINNSVGRLKANFLTVGSSVRIL